MRTLITAILAGGMIFANLPAAASAVTLAVPLSSQIALIGQTSVDFDLAQLEQQLGNLHSSLTPDQTVRVNELVEGYSEKIEHADSAQVQAAKEALNSGVLTVLTPTQAMDFNAQLARPAAGIGG